MHSRGIKSVRYLALGVSFMALLAGASSSARAEEPVMTLRDAVAVGVNTNPETGIVQSNRRATDEELRQARALYLPSIDLRADTGAEHSDDPATRGGLDDNDTEELWRYEAGLTLTQLLFDGFETKYENVRQKNRVKSASSRVRETAELVGLSVVEAYLDVIRQRELLKIARENVAEHLAIMEQIEDSAAADVLRALMSNKSRRVWLRHGRRNQMCGNRSGWLSLLIYAKSGMRRETCGFRWFLLMRCLPVLMNRSK